MATKTTRIWGENARGLTLAGAPVERLQALEDTLLAAVDVPGRGRYDAHVHLGRDADGHGLDASDLIADMDRWGIAKAVCFPANEPGEDGNFRQANLAVLEASRREPMRLTPFCRLDPKGEWRPALEAAAAGGAQGLKLHPVAQSFHPESDASVAAVSAETDLGWPVLFHAGFGARRLAAPLVTLVRAVPNARLILAHAGRGDGRALKEAFAGNARVAFDTSLAQLADLVTLPVEQLMFGSDRPYGEHGTALHLVLKAAGIAGWSAEQLDGVLGGNIESWLS